MVGVIGFFTCACFHQDVVAEACQRGNGSGHQGNPVLLHHFQFRQADSESPASTIVNGQIKSIEILNRGIDYTRATVTIIGGGGYGAIALANIDGRVGTIRTVYYDSFSQRQIVDQNAGDIDYDTGTITISDILIKDVQSVDGDIRLSIESEKGIINTQKNTIITIDEDDPTSISTTLETV